MVTILICKEFLTGVSHNARLSAPWEMKARHFFGVAQWIEKRHKSKAGAAFDSTTAFSPSPLETTTDPDLTTQLERHIEELAYGGWADRKPNLDEQEAN